MHGDASTGARTPEGKARAAAANLKHGGFSKETIEMRAALRRSRAEAEELVSRLLAEADAAAITKTGVQDA
jgi:hypothetical protein